MRLFAPIVALIGIAVVASAAAYLAWDLDWRWRPHTITRDHSAIATALAQSGWVSPQALGPKVYLIVAGQCPPCASLDAKLLPALLARGVDTRVIVIAPADENGRPNSSPQDRAVVAELWANRSWPRFRQWAGLPGPLPFFAPPPPAVGDAGRTAIVEAGRALVAQLTPWLKHSGVEFAYPTLVWWTGDGRMRACACTDARTYPFVERELGEAAAAHQGNSRPS